MRNLLLLGLLILVTLFTTSLQAHEFSTANLTLKQSSQDSHEGYIAVSVSDLHRTLNLDAQNDGQLTWQELKNSHPTVIRYLNENLIFSSGGQSCEPEWGSDISLLDSYGETLLKQPLSLQCPIPISVNYSALFDTTSDHKLLLNWQVDKGQAQTIIDTPNQPWQLTSASQSAWDTFLFYLYQGMIHIWIGLDHILFVLTLLLHFVNKPIKALSSDNKPLSPVKLKSMIWLITGFTIAHSITLTLTALGWISIPSKWAEVGIAISVAYSALNVMTHWIRQLMLMTVAFGLLHGLGFAGALTELGLSKSHQLTSIIGFNLGVEIGQVVIILAAMPFLWLLNKQEKVRKISVPLISIAIMALGLMWVWQRI